MEEDLDWLEELEEKEEDFPATKVMMEEHRYIERALNVLKKAVNKKIEDEELYLSLADFFSNYADRIHHGKEEDILFKILRSKGAPRHVMDIVEALEEDHKVGRELVRKIRENAGNFGSLKDYALAYYSMLKKHIAKEDEGLFPAMHPYLSAEEEKEMLKDFEKVDEGKEKYEKLVEYLEGRV